MRLFRHRAAPAPALLDRAEYERRILAHEAALAALESAKVAYGAALSRSYQSGHDLEAARRAVSPPTDAAQPIPSIPTARVTNSMKGR